MKILIRYSLTFIVTFLFSGCDGTIPAGRIMVKNDSQDREYNVVVVSGGGVRYRLNPGDGELLPKGTTTISFSRKYKDYTRSYTVSCPSRIKEGILIKLIDVHLNRMPGGCKTVSASKG